MIPDLAIGKLKHERVFKATEIKPDARELLRVIKDEKVPRDK